MSGLGGLSPAQAKQTLERVGARIAGAKDAIERCRELIPGSSEYQDQLGAALAALGMAELAGEQVLARRTRS